MKKQSDRGRWITLSTLLLLLPLSAGALEMEIESGEVVVRGATPGGKVALVGRVWRFEDMARTARSRLELATDADLDGIVRVPSGDGSVAVWGAVEVGTGALVLAVPPGEQELSTVEFPADGLQPGATESSLEKLAFPSERFAGLWVRPGVGAWALGVADGSERDLDGLQDGRATTDVTAASALDPAVPPPSSFASGDVLVIVDSQTLAVSTTVIP